MKLGSVAPASLLVCGTAAGEEAPPNEMVKAARERLARYERVAVTNHPGWNSFGINPIWTSFIESIDARTTKRCDTAIDRDGGSRSQG
jgi:hypothetical protein